jgi:hypothetical protein
MKKVTDPESQKYLKITVLRGGLLMFYPSCMIIEAENTTTPPYGGIDTIIVSRVVVVKGLSAQRSRG